MAGITAVPSAGVEKFEPSRTSLGLTARSVPLGAGGLAITERRAFLLKLDDDKRIEIAAIGYSTVGMRDDPLGDQTCCRVVPVN